MLYNPRSVLILTALQVQFLPSSILPSYSANNAMIDVLLAWVRCFQRRRSSEQTKKSAPELHTKRFIFNQHAASVILTFTLPTTNPPWLDQVSLRNWAKLLRCDERNGNTKEFHRLLRAAIAPRKLIDLFFCPSRGAFQGIRDDDDGTMMMIRSQMSV